LAYKIYGKETISERHRRYEYNSSYVEQLQKQDCYFWVNPDTGLVEIVEIKDHPFYGVQYHPEYKSTVANPHPILYLLQRLYKQRRNNRM
jgi:CTP synthase